MLDFSHYSVCIIGHFLSLFVTIDYRLIRKAFNFSLANISALIPFLIVS